MVRTLLVLVLLLVGGMAMPVAAEEVTLNGVTLALPEGEWSREDGSGIILTRSWPADSAVGRDENGAAFIQITPAVSSGTFVENFVAVLNFFPDLLDDDALISREGITSNGHQIYMEVRCCTREQGLTVAATTVGINGPDRQQFLVFAEVELEDEDLDLAEADFASVVRSVRFPGEDAGFALVPPDGGGGLEGVYTTLETSLMPNVFGGLDFTSESAIVALDPSGLFSSSIPAGGDMAQHCAAVPTECGTYRLDGGSIEMGAVIHPFGIIETTTETFAQAGDSLRIGEADYDLVPPLPAGSTFSGTWDYFYASSGITASGAGGVSVERTLTFTPDGRFSQTGSSGFMSSSDIGGSTTSVAGANTKPADGGTYSIDGYELTLVDANGATQTLSLFLPEPGSDDLLVIDGNNYLRQD